MHIAEKLGDIKGVHCGKDVPEGFVLLVVKKFVDGNINSYKVPFHKCFLLKVIGGSKRHFPSVYIAVKLINAEKSAKIILQLRPGTVPVLLPASINSHLSEIIICGKQNFTAIL